MKIKDKVLKERKVLIEKALEEYSKERGEPFIFNYATIQEFGLRLLEKNLASVGKVIDEEFLKNMNDGGCSCGSFFNFIDGKFICNSCQEECENKFYEELKQKLGI